MARESFIFYKSFYESIKELDLEKQTEIYNAIFSYQFDDIEVELKGISKSIFTLILPVLKSNNTKYKNGCKGGAPKGNTNALKQPKNNLEITEKQPKNNPMKRKEEEEDVDVDVDVDVEGEEIMSDKVASNPPTLADILLYSEEIGLKDKEYCEKFFNHYESIGWVNGTGQQIKNWKLVFNNWCKKDGLLKEKEKKKYMYYDDNGNLVEEWR